MLSYRELQRAAALIDRDFRGARVQRIVQAGMRELCLVLRDARRETTGLHFCVEPARARVLRGAAPRGDGAAASGFSELLRARLKSQHLRGARILSRDRLVEFVFDNELCLLLAVMGPRSNLLLLDGDQRVLGSLRPLPETHRRLRPGGVWEAPKSDPPREGADRFAELDDDAWWEAMRGHYQGLESREHDEAVQRRVAKALRKARQALDKKRGLLEGDIAAGEEAARLRQDGERLKSVIAELAPGVGEARGSDFATGEEFYIELDPAKTPRATLQDLFAKARKAEKRAARGGAGLAELEERDAALRGLEVRFEACGDDSEEVAAFAETLEAQTLLRRFAPEGRSKTSPPAVKAKPLFTVGRRELPRRLWPRRYRSRDGLEIWVGRSDEGNDILSTRLARGRDLFFHLDAAPGSHVILRTEGRSDPPSESLLDAAELAVHFSKARSATRADVHIAPARLVRKPKGSKPGLVSVGGGRNLHLRREPARLERVLGARIDEG